MIKIVSLVNEEPLELLKVYEGEFLIKLEEIFFTPTNYYSIYETKRYRDIKHYTKNTGYQIKDLGWFPANKFITLAEFREKQIDSIIN